VPARILASDQHRQLERFAEADSTDLFRRRLGDEQVPALERLPKGGPGAASERPLTTREEAASK
jgi:hypothetical protein